MTPTPEQTIYKRLHIAEWLSLGALCAGVIFAWSELKADVGVNSASITSQHELLDRYMSDVTARLERIEDNQNDHLRFHVTEKEN